MTFNPATLTALKGNFMVGVKTQQVFKAVDLVRLKKAINSGIYDQSYDMNSDGVLDDIDVEILTRLVFENL